MTAWFGTVALAGSAWLGFALIGALGIRLVWCARVREREGQAAADRVREIERFAWAATVVPTMLLVAAVLPGLLALLGGGDHCERHAEHLHLCLVHPAALSATGAAWVALLWVWVAHRAWQRLLPERVGWLTWRRIARLHSAERRALEHLPSQQAFSVAAGLWRPRVWISEGFWSAHSPDEREIVVAHEQAHVRRRDPLRRALIAVLSLPLDAATRRDLLGAWTLASEQLCDEAAADGVGDRLRVAETILNAERLLDSRSVPPLSTPAFGGGDTALRVRSLLEPARPSRGRSRRWWLVAVMAASAGVLASAGAVHHLTEHALDLVLRIG
jgi:hypothetical protein